jgi:glycosyltransferase involved in cell wall biosynthesis
MARGDRVNGWNVRAGRTSERRLKGSPVPVLYIAHSGRIGSANRIFMNLMTWLDPSRYAPYLVAPASGPLTEWADQAGVPWRVVPNGDMAGRLGMVRRLQPLISAARSVDARVIHAIDVGAYRAAGLVGMLVGARRVSHVHLPETADDLAWSLPYGPDMLMTCYQAQARDVERALGGSKPACRVVGVPNAVDTNLFVPQVTEQSTALRFGGRHVVLIVGHLSEVKGYPTFLRACPLIEAALPGCQFIALGGETITQGYRAELEKMARDLSIDSRVHFLGWRENVGEVINAADVVVLPSLNEGLPLAVLEAMACGKPVVATPVGGVPEAVEHGTTGLLVPPNDPVALSNAVTDILKDPETARRMGRLSRCRVEQRFSLPVFVDRVQMLYDQLLNPTRTNRFVADLKYSPSLLLAAGLVRV